MIQPVDVSLLFYSDCFLINLHKVAMQIVSNSWNCQTVVSNLNVPSPSVWHPVICHTAIKRNRWGTRHRTMTEAAYSRGELMKLLTVNRIVKRDLKQGLLWGSTILCVQCLVVRWRSTNSESAETNTRMRWDCDGNHVKLFKSSSTNWSKPSKTKMIWEIKEKIKKSAVKIDKSTVFIREKLTGRVLEAISSQAENSDATWGRSHSEKTGNLHRSVFESDGANSYHVIFLWNFTTAQWVTHTFQFFIIYMCGKIHLLAALFPAENSQQLLHQRSQQQWDTAWARRDWNMAMQPNRTIPIHGRSFGLTRVEIEQKGEKQLKIEIVEMMPATIRLKTWAGVTGSCCLVAAARPRIHQLAKAALFPEPATKDTRKKALIMFRDALIEQNNQTQSGEKRWYIPHSPVNSSMECLEAETKWLRNSFSKVCKEESRR